MRKISDRSEAKEKIKIGKTCLDYRKLIQFVVDLGDRVSKNTVNRQVTYKISVTSCLLLDRRLPWINENC